MPGEHERAKEQLEKLGQDWEAFKKENDQRLKKLENNGGVADFEEKLARINEALDESGEKLKQLDKEKQAREALEERLEQIELAQKRPGKSASSESQEAGEYRSAWGKFMRKGSNEAELLEKSGSVGSDPDGGYAVPEMLNTNIIQLLRDVSPMRQLATVVPVSNEEYKQLVNKNGAAGGWVGETDARPETQNPQIAQFAPAFGELYANPAATQKLLDDAVFDVENWYSEEVAGTFAEMEGTAFTSGDGINKPKGFLAYPTAANDTNPAYGTIGKIVGSGVGTVAADDVIDLTYALKAGYRQNARMMMQGTTVAKVRKLKDANEQYLWQQSLIMGEPSTLAGYAVSENEDMPEVATGALAIAFGDFSRAYRIFDVRGIRTLRDPYTNKPFVHFYTTKRVGGGCSNTQAIKLLEVA